jgi:hypothetical protein
MTLGTTRRALPIRVRTAVGEGDDASARVLGVVEVVVRRKRRMGTERLRPGGLVP